MRLDKALSLAGMSRSEARRAIQSGRVSVNGKCEKDAGLPVAVPDAVCLDGRALALKLHTHLMLYKPAGVLTATRDEKGERTVMDLVPPALRRAHMGPVGRLDKDVTGLVILTTDGQLAHRLISPKRGVEKLYEALAEGRVGEKEVEAFRNGLDLGDFTARSAALEPACAEGENTLCRVRVTEGKFHEVKRMFEKVGHPVLRLKRLNIAGLALDEKLAEGESRLLSESEEALLYRAAGMTEI
ncbi:MAG: rRNA pseudouridine synthase [Clostridia bacterium]|nr:rRNA pseudouridine synthase [Clostridia bacterium]